MKQNPKARNQEISTEISIYGHDAFLCARGICDDKGKRIFADKDMPILNSKSGEAIGFIAKEIVAFSGMDSDLEELEELKN